MGRSKATERPVWPFARLRRYSALLVAAEECPAYVRITHGRSRSSSVGNGTGTSLERRAQSYWRVTSVPGDGGHIGEDNAVVDDPRFLGLFGGLVLMGLLTLGLRWTFGTGKNLRIPDPERPRAATGCSPRSPACPRRPPPRCCAPG